MIARNIKDWVYSNRRWLLGTVILVLPQTALVFLASAGGVYWWTVLGLCAAILTVRIVTRQMFILPRYRLVMRYEDDTFEETILSLRNEECMVEVRPWTAQIVVWHTFQTEHVMGRLRLPLEEEEPTAGHDKETDEDSATRRLQRLAYWLGLSPLRAKGRFTPSVFRWGWFRRKVFSDV